MTQEQKAKAYDEALERMKSWVRGEHPECFTEAQKAAEFIFPELKESEDEKIIREITAFFRKAAGGYLDTSTSCKTYSKWLAWLEKKGQQKSGVESIKYSHITTANSQFFQWIYDRLKYVYNEDPNKDYMLSLKERIEEMQKPTWKPSDMELETLRLIAEKDGTCLKSLYEKLKKLK